MKDSVIFRGSELFEYEFRGRVLYPQQLQVGAALDERKPTTAILMPRRSAKTESVLLWIFAMMVEHPGLQVAFTMATTREAARSKFLADVLPIMEQLAELRDDVHLLKGAGYERVDIKGSSFVVLAPTDKAFRSKAFDVVIVDEAGSDDADGEELLSALLPTMDTSWLGMLILMGTAGEFRAGNLLWNGLHDPDASVVDYSLGDAIELDMLGDWEYVSAKLEQYHPGVGTLTTLAKLKRNYALLKPELFAREYLGLWGDKGGAGGMFSADQLANLYLPTKVLPDPPKRFALAVAASDSHAAIVCAWREDGVGRLLVIRHGEGRTWLPVAARDLARKYRVPIVLDPSASQVMQDVKQRIEQIRPAPTLALQEYEDVGAAHERLKLDIENGLVSHYGQESLTGALLAVKQLQMGRKWKFHSEGDITPAQAATLALRHYDSMPRTSRGTLQAVAV